MQDKTWRLAPAYDLAYSYKPGSPWVNSHWMSLNGKRDHFTREDFYSLEPLSPLFTRRRINSIIDEISAQVAQWPSLAKEHEVPIPLREEITQHLRLGL